VIPVRTKLSPITLTILLITVLVIGCVLYTYLTREETSGAVIEVLPDTKYYTEVLKAIRSSKKYILVAMYLAKYDPDDLEDRANDLLRELIKARQRGVKVYVYLEYRTYSGTIKENLLTATFLKRFGVEVRLDNQTDTDHMKLVIVDGEVAFVGSHNWSEAALTYNHELSVKIKSREVVKVLERYFWLLWHRG